MKVYLCGGINGLTDDQAMSWREYAKEALPGIEWLDPMRHDYRGREGENVSEIVERDLEDIIHADALLVNASRPSWGTAMEIPYAYIVDKPIFAFVGTEQRVSPWLQYHCTEIHITIDEALAAVSVWSEKKEGK